MSDRTRGLAVLAAACLLVFAGAAVAQTSTTETKSFEIVSVDGNNVVVRGAEGTRELTVADDFSLNVGGKPIGVHDLKPGMKGTATITTTTTTKPVYVTEVKNGEVLKVTGSSVIVRTEKGFRSFNEGDMAHRNVSILRDGKPVRLADLNAGDRLTATIVTEGEPQVLTERQVQANMAPDAPKSYAPEVPKSHTPAASTATADASGNSGGAAAPAATATAATPAEGESAALPTTASPLPLLALVGLAALAIASALVWRRRRA